MLIIRHKHNIITLLIWKFNEKLITLQSVFHGIRLLRLIKFGCRETINFFVPIHEQIVMVLKMAHLEEVGMSHRLSKQGLL